MAWRDGLTDADAEHVSRYETLRRVIDFVRAMLESTDDMDAESFGALMPFNEPMPA